MVRSVADDVLFSMTLFNTIISILSSSVGWSLGVRSLPFTTVSPVALVLTTAAVAVTGVGITGAVVTENACADHKRQSLETCIVAESKELPAPITEETSKMPVSQSGPSLPANR